MLNFEFWADFRMVFDSLTVATGFTQVRLVSFALIQPQLEATLN